jgi:hypothetical protein
MNLIGMRSGLKVLPLFGTGSLPLAHLLTAAAFGRRTDAIIARLEQVSVAEPSTPPVPAIIQSFAQRAVCENPVPNTVWLKPEQQDARQPSQQPARPGGNAAAIHLAVVAPASLPARWNNVAPCRTRAVVGFDVGDITVLEDQPHPCRAARAHS